MQIWHRWDMIVIHSPIEPFGFIECIVVVPLALWNDAELELVPNKIIWLLEAVVMLLMWPLPLLELCWWSPLLLSILLWITVCTDVLLDTDDCCWNICWCEWCKLFARDLVRFNGTSAMSFSSRKRNQTMWEFSMIAKRGKKTQNVFIWLKKNKNNFEWGKWLKEWIQMNVALNLLDKWKTIVRVIQF